MNGIDYAAIPASLHPLIRRVDAEARLIGAVGATEGAREADLQIDRADTATHNLAFLAVLDRYAEVASIQH